MHILKMDERSIFFGKNSCSLAGKLADVLVHKSDLLFTLLVGAINVPRGRTSVLHVGGQISRGCKRNLQWLATEFT